MAAFVSDAEIKSIWRRFINREETPEDIENLDPVIYDSWVRSRELEVDAVEKKEKILSPEELRALQDENRTLVAVTRSYLEKLYSFLEGENFVVFLTDKKGVVLDIMGGTGSSMRKERDEVLLCAGAYRDEGYVGTTSAGLCMHLDRPIQVCGAEHYFEDYHNHTCSSVPIHGLDGSVLGSLGILGLVTAHYRHTLGMAVAAADGIEKELRLRHSYNNIRLAHDQLSSTFQAMTSGLIMLDNAGRVLHHNSQACKILGLFNAELTGTSVLEILQFDGIPGILSLEEAVYSKEVRVKHLRSRKEVSLLLTACPVGSAEERAGIVLTFDPVQRVNKLISQRSGFSARFTFEDITGNSPAMVNAKGLASLAAEKNSTVLILGESGTGKELFAHAIHSAGERASGPFVAINCAALPHG
ncbi:MAG: sigma 54-interacting transcriptional regulator, partial [Firmicutes bacterium]|nr:sigma 54-interacting transcriptional regulator [Bacillota bacterium]